MQEAGTQSHAREGLGMHETGTLVQSCHRGLRSIVNQKLLEHHTSSMYSTATALSSFTCSPALPVRRCASLNCWDDSCSTYEQRQHQAATAWLKVFTPSLLTHTGSKCSEDCSEHTSL